MVFVRYVEQRLIYNILFYLQWRREWLPHRPVDYHCSMPPEDWRENHINLGRRKCLPTSTNNRGIMGRLPSQTTSHWANHPWEGINDSKNKL
ncbi:hypothetical protein C0J52_28450 [Blattella germanica]|nr:hypothetical protein C0J52_28450 [Blattella germanica]